MLTIAVIDWLIDCSYGQKQPEVRSNIQWININPGLFPPPRVTYENWITPNAYPSQWFIYNLFITIYSIAWLIFLNQYMLVALCDCAAYFVSLVLLCVLWTRISVYTPAVQWSPRRHHCAVFFNNYIWVLGGRARELVDFSEARWESLSVKVSVVNDGILTGR